MSAKNNIRKKIWEKQPTSFKKTAIINIDGTISETYGQCKQGMDISYNGKWGYTPLIRWSKGVNIRILKPNVNMSLNSNTGLGSAKSLTEWSYFVRPLKCWKCNAGFLMISGIFFHRQWRQKICRAADSILPQPGRPWERYRTVEKRCICIEQSVWFPDIQSGVYDHSIFVLGSQGMVRSAASKPGIGQEYCSHGIQKIYPYFYPDSVSDHKIRKKITYRLVGYNDQLKHILKCSIVWGILHFPDTNSMIGRLSQMGCDGWVQTLERQD